MLSVSITAVAVSYVFLAMGMQQIARSRGINNPWFAWLPVFRGWLLGCISDQYRFVARGSTTRRRTWLVALPVLETVLWIISFFVGVFHLILSAEPGSALDTTSIVMLALLTLVRLAYFILENMAVYDLHRSCNPENAGLFLFLGMVIPCFRALVVYMNREKELGMPPRRSASV